MKLYFITTNEGKYKEVKEILHKYKIDIEMLSAQYTEIQCDVLQDVVMYGIESLSKEYLDIDFLVEDSGLFIESLGGFPGVYSAYVFKTIGCEGILKIMEDIENRSAKFISCVGALINGNDYIFTGEVHGRISDECRGEGGFGYDPIFIPSKEKKTFAEMTTEEKNRISHRRRSVEKLGEFIKNEFLKNSQ